MNPIEIKINREIRDFTENIFFGLSLRQLACSAGGMAVAAGLYFLLKPRLGTETVSWVCILGAAPFALMGFVRYNGMNAERFAWAWCKSMLLTPSVLPFRARNLYWEAMQAAKVKTTGKERPKREQKELY